MPVGHWSFLFPYLESIFLAFGNFRGFFVLCLEILHTVRRGLKIGSAPGLRFDP